MTGVFWRKPLSNEDMPEVPATIVAEDLSPPAIGIRFPPYRSRYFIIEARPSAPGGELVLRFVKRCLTTSANVDARRFVVVVFSGEGAFCTFMHDDPLLFRVE